MPLIKRGSKQAFEHNVKAEMHSGKPQDQSLAIAYDIKRQARRKKMAKGGQITAANQSRPMPDQSFNDSADVRRASNKKADIEGSWTDNPSVREAGQSKPSMHSEIDIDFVSERRAKADNSRTPEEMRMRRPSSDPMHINKDHDDDIEDARYADGGRVELDPMANADDADDSISGAILRKRQMMADGGMVDIQENGREMPADPSPYDHDNEEAILKELYDDGQLDAQPMDSNEHGDDIDSDAHDHIEEIRRKIMYKRR